MRWNNIPFPKLQRLQRRSLRIDKWFHPKICNGCNYFSMLELTKPSTTNLLHVLWDILYGYKVSPNTVVNLNIFTLLRLCHACDYISHHFFISWKHVNFPWFNFHIYKTMTSQLVMLWWDIISQSWNNLNPYHTDLFLRNQECCARSR